MQCEEVANVKNNRLLRYIKNKEFSKITLFEWERLILVIFYAMFALALFLVGAFLIFAILSTNATLIGKIIIFEIGGFFIITALYLVGMSNNSSINEYLYKYYLQIMESESSEDNYDEYLREFVNSLKSMQEEDLFSNDKDTTYSIRFLSVYLRYFLTLPGIPLKFKKEVMKEVKENLSGKRNFNVIHLIRKIDKKIEKNYPELRSNLISYFRTTGRIKQEQFDIYSFCYEESKGWGSKTQGFFGTHTARFFSNPKPYLIFFGIIVFILIVTGILPSQPIEQFATIITNIFGN